MWTHAFRTAPNSPINPATDDLGTLGPGIRSGPATTTATNELILGADTIATTTTGVRGVVLPVESSPRLIPTLWKIKL
jgi:hypothetical protein